MVSKNKHNILGESLKIKKNFNKKYKASKCYILLKTLHYI